MRYIGGKVDKLLRNQCKYNCNKISYLKWKQSANLCTPMISGFIMGLYSVVFGSSARH